MNVKILEKNPKHVKFVLEKATPAFANALRQIMVAEIPIMAIDYADIEKNSTGLFDELLAHRLGLIPLKFNPKLFNLREECKCGGRGCSRCEVVFSLEGTGPCTLHSGDLKSNDESVKPADPNIPIVELLEGRTLKLQAVASLGLGKNHTITVVNSIECPLCMYCVDNCEKDAIAVTGDSKNIIFTVESTLIRQALDILDKKLLDFRDELEKVVK